MSQAVDAKRSVKPVIEENDLGVGKEVVGREVGKAVVGREVVGAIVFFKMDRDVGT